VKTAGIDSPVAAARVTLSRLEDSPGITTRRVIEPVGSGRLVITDASGRFKFGGLDAGTYRIAVARNGYGDKTTEQISLTASQSLTDVSIWIAPTAKETGAVSGRIRNSSGRPIAGLSVQLVQRKYDSDGMRSVESIAETATNDFGEYRMYGVKPGRYFVVATAGTRLWTLNRNIVHEQPYADAFYPGVAGVDDASVIDLQPGGDVTGIDIPVARSALYRIRGRVIDPRTGKPPEQISLSVTSGQWSVRTSVGVGYNPANGTFETNELLPGTYLLSGRLRTTDDSRPAPKASVVVTVENADVESLLLTLADPVAVSGSVRVEGDAATTVGLDQFKVVLIPVGRATRLLGALEAWPDKQGLFILNDVDRREYRVGIGWLPKDLYIKDARLDGGDVLNTTRRFDNSGKLEILLSSDGGRVAGTVTKKDLQLAPGAQVFLVPSEDRGRDDLLKTVAADQNGRFTFSGVAPGNYRLLAVEDFEPNAHLAPDAFKPFEREASLIQVGDSSSQSVNLTVIPRPVQP
jgi:protocatechuate 3,4-dioxygenase beta subunit